MIESDTYDNLPLATPIFHKDLILENELILDKPTYKFLIPTYWGSTMVINNADGYINPFNKPVFYWIYGYIINIEKQKANQENHERQQQRYPTQDIPIPIPLPPKNDNFSEELYKKMEFESDSKSLNAVGKYKIDAPTSSEYIIYSIKDKSNNSIKFYGESTQQNIVITECKGDNYIELINFLIKIINDIEQGNYTKINLYLSKKSIDGYEKKMVENPLKDSNNFENRGSFKTVAEIKDIKHLNMYKFIPIPNRGGSYTRKSRKTKSRKTKSRKTKSRKSKSRK